MQLRNLECQRHMTFADSIRDARAKLGYSLRELAALTEVSATHLCDIEHDRRYASDESLTRLTDVLKYEPGYLWALCGKLHPIVQNYLKEHPEYGVALHAYASRDKLQQEGKHAGDGDGDIFRR